MKFDAVRELNRALADSSQPLLIKFDENNCIVAAHYSYESRYDMGIVFRLAESRIDIGVSVPGGMNEEQVENWTESVDVNLSEGLPGLAIVAGMNDEEATELGLRAVDMGGPASGGVPMVEFSGDSRSFQDALTKKKLPFRLVFGLD